MTSLDGVRAALAEMLGEAARILEMRGAGGRRFEASVFRCDGAIRRVAVETGRPSRAAAAILRLFRERIETLADPLDPGFGFDAMRLAVPVIEPLGQAQADFEDAVGDETDVCDLLDRLGARFGGERVVRFAPRDSHDPDREARRLPLAASPSGPCSWPAPEPREAPARPLLVFRPPQPIEVTAEVPDGPPAHFRWRRIRHDVALAEGPERIAPEWWRESAEAETRDYYRVEDAEGRRYWVFRRGFYGDGEGARWFLHGLFA